MSDELQAEIDRLKAENAKLTKELTGLGDELKDVRHEARDRRHENKSLLEQVTTLTADRDGWKTRAEADPDGLRKAVADAQGTVRGLKHERAYEKVAKGLKVNDPAKLTDLVKLAGYTPEGDEPDEAKIAETFQATLKERPWLVDAETPKPAAPGGATTASGGAHGATGTETGGKPGPGSDRGQSLESKPGQPPGRPAGRL